MSRQRMSFKDALDHADSLDLPDGAALAMAKEFSGVDACDGVAEIAGAQQAEPLYKVKPIGCKYCPRRFDSGDALQKHITAKRRNKCIRHGLEPRR